MDYATWMVHKSECENAAQVPFQRMSGSAQAAMKEAGAAGAIIEGLWITGAWGRVSGPDWHPGGIYRVAPSWPGPAKLEPAPQPQPQPEYEDLPVRLVDDGHWRVRVGMLYCFLSNVTIHRRFAGYVYEINGRTAVRPELLFDSRPDETYRLRVPNAVRFVKQ
jgi:hypothetical protein